MTLLTTGVIANRLNVDRDEVSYAVRKLAVKPTGIAGQVRIYPDAVIPVVNTFLEAKTKKRASGNGQGVSARKDGGATDE